MPESTFTVLTTAERGTAPLHLAKSRLKEIRGLGYKLERFLQARSACWQHIRKRGLSQVLRWADPEGLNPASLAGEGLFATALSMDGDRVKLLGTLLPAEVTSRFARLWHDCDWQAPRELPAVLPIPADADQPLWLALLRLRPLRSFWERELRRATLDSLLELLPDAWVLDPSPLPPGAVIPRLEIPSWSGLPEVAMSRGGFTITSHHGNRKPGPAAQGSSPTTQEWQAAIAEALGAFETAPHVLVQGGFDPPPGNLHCIAFYERTAGRVEGVGLLGLVPDSAGRLRASPVMAA